MLRLFALLVLASGFVFTPQTNVTNSWRGIVPLRSTRADVERLLGGASKSHGQTRIYKTKSERVDVSYSSGRCGQGQLWNVGPGVVTRLVVTPQQKTLIQDVDTTGYVRVMESHPENWVQYWSADGGIFIQTIKTHDAEEILSITYQPTKNEKALKCPPPRRRTVLKR